MSLAPVRVVDKENLKGSYNDNKLSYVKLGPEEGGGLVLKVDNVELNVGDSVLLAFQDNANENGVYQVNKAGLEWEMTRREDFKSKELMKAGSYVCVGGGDVGAGSCWTLIEPAPAELGVSYVVFASCNGEKSPIPEAVNVPGDGGKLSDKLPKPKSEGEHDLAKPKAEHHKDHK